MNYYGNSMYYNHMMSDAFGRGFFPVFMTIMMAIIIFLLISLVVEYIFSSIGLYTMAKNRNISHPWLAWVPFAKEYLQGELINDDVSIGSWHIPYAKIFLPLLPIVVSVVGGFLGLIPYIGVVFIWIITLAFSFYSYTALYWLFNIYSPKHRVVFLVLSIIFPFLCGIFIFAIRHNQGFDERHPEPVGKDNYDSRSIFALSLGISSIFSFFCLSGIVGIITSNIAMKERKALGEPHGMALAGLICSIAGIVLKFLLFFLLITLFFLAVASY
ncbi:MAG: DUF4190 domain-containing protein [Eubacteriaceae bacterium]